jgi:guanylate kinase
MMPTKTRRGLMLVISSPSGAGKTTLSRRLLEDDLQVAMSVSATTRQPRPNERYGIDYYFVDDARFDDMVGKQEFLEHASVFGERYGTPRQPVETALSKGRDVLFDIDWQGTQQIAEAARGDLVSIFILPPSMEILEQRLRTRASDSDETVRYRMSKAAAEISHWAEYDYVLVNDNLDTCLAQIKTILAAERLKRTRQITLSSFVRNLLGDEG